MNQSYQTRLAEILDKLLTIGEMYTPEDVAEAQQQITQLFLEIIGEDEKLKLIDTFRDHKVIRNQLRAEIRKAIEG